MDKSSEVYRIVSQIPVGKVMTYGQIGKMVGISPRQVGRILHENPDPENVPCHRVVNAKGEVARNYAFGGGKTQAEKLRGEGVEFSDNKVDLARHSGLARIKGQI